MSDRKAEHKAKSETEQPFAMGKAKFETEKPLPILEKISSLTSSLEADLLATPLEVYIAPGAATVETIANVLKCLSDLHVAAGGLGIAFDSDGLPAGGFQ